MNNKHTEAKVRYYIYSFDLEQDLIMGGSRTSPRRGKFSKKLYEIKEIFVLDTQT